MESGTFNQVCVPYYSGSIDDILLLTKSVVLCQSTEGPAVSHSERQRKNDLLYFRVSIATPAKNTMRSLRCRQPIATPADVTTL